MGASCTGDARQRVQTRAAGRGKGAAQPAAPSSPPARGPPHPRPPIVRLHHPFTDPSPPRKESSTADSNSLTQTRPRHRPWQVPGGPPPFLHTSCPGPPPPCSGPGDPTCPPSKKTPLGGPFAASPLEPLEVGGLRIPQAGGGRLQRPHVSPAAAPQGLPCRAPPRPLTDRGCAGQGGPGRAQGCFLTPSGPGPRKGRGLRRSQSEGGAHRPRAPSQRQRARDKHGAAGVQEVRGRTSGGRETAPRAAPPPWLASRGGGGEVSPSNGVQRLLRAVTRRYRGRAEVWLLGAKAGCERAATPLRHAGSACARRSAHHTSVDFDRLRALRSSGVGCPRPDPTWPPRDAPGSDAASLRLKGPAPDWKGLVDAPCWPWSGPGGGSAVDEAGLQGAEHLGQWYSNGGPRPTWWAAT